MAVNDLQVGGDHYHTKYQHWDFIEEHGIGYLEAAATKYATRWRKKNGRQDLEKSLHYIDKLIDLHQRRHRLPRGIAPMDAVLRFSRANSLTAYEQIVVQYLSRWDNEADLRQARVYVCRLINECDLMGPSEDWTGQDHPFGFEGEA